MDVSDAMVAGEIIRHILGQMSISISLVGPFANFYVYPFGFCAESSSAF
jgi:hypothetical protein